MKDKLDRFYTNVDTAKQCIDILVDTVPFLSSSSRIVEPSAGSGSFLEALKQSGFNDIIAFDIAPSSDEIKRADFLSVTSDDCGRASVFVGNPPFGERSVMAKQFITHCIDLGADIIAFILPNTFNKITMQKVFPSDWRLVSATRLDKDSFHMPNGSSYGVPTSFLIWTKRKDIMPDVELRERKYPVPYDWKYTIRGDKAADLCINGNSGKVRYPSDITNPKAEHFIKCADCIDIDDVIAVFEAARNNELYRMESSVNGGNYWICRNELNHAYDEAKRLLNNENKQSN